MPKLKIRVSTAFRLLPAVLKVVILPNRARMTTVGSITLPADWKRVIVVPVHKGGDRSLFTNYRPVSLTSVVCKQMEHGIASYLRQVWDKNDWL